MNAAMPLQLTVRTADLRDPAECARIDAFVAEHSRASLFHRPQWSRAVERGCGQRPLYLVAERAGTLVGCLPLTDIRSRLFGNALVSVGFATGGGILADSDPVAVKLAEAGWDLARKIGSASMELRGGPLPEGWHPQEGTYANFERELLADADAMLNAIPKRQRSEVKRALRADLQVTIGSDERHRAAHFRVYSESVRNLGTPVFPQRLFSASLDEFGPDAEVIVVWHDERPLAALLNFVSRHSYQPFWGGGTSEARTWKANDLIYYAALRRGIELGCTRADFGRSKVGTGPWQRKRIWGFAEKPLVYGVRSAGGRAPREINPLDPKFRVKIAAWQKLPLWLANRLGPVIARGLG